jgi:hypothetical protein
MRSPNLSLIVVASSLLLVACEDSFTPKGPYTDKMVVYAILSTQTDTQYVRLYTTYNPQGFNPYENSIDKAIHDATVTVTLGASSTEYRDTLVERYNKARYKDDIGAYVAYPFRAQPGKSYNLAVESQSYGSVTASLAVPDRGRLQVSNKYVLRGEGDKNENLVVFVWVRYATRGYLVRYYFDFDVLQGGVWVRRRAEIPSGVVVIDNDHKIYDYPKLQKRITTPGSVVKEEQEAVYFSRRALELALADLYAQYTYSGMRVKGAWFVLTQVEQNLYNYYMVSNGFQDAYSIRTDVPNWTNIKGGNGVFGAFVEDSLYVDLSVSN